MPLIGALVIAAGACHPVASAGRVAAQSFNPSLRAELIQLGVEDQAAREGFAAALSHNDTSYVRLLLTGDSARTNRLRQIVRDYGWPGRTLVGNDGANAAWLILQHSSSLAFQKALLPTLWIAAKKAEVSKADLALLTDRVLVRSGHPQLYGTQFFLKDGSWVPNTIENISALESRRRAIGLPPMAEYVKMLAKTGLPVIWPPPQTRDR